VFAGRFAYKPRAGSQGPRGEALLGKGLVESQATEMNSCWFAALNLGVRYP